MHTKFIALIATSAILVLSYKVGRAQARYKNIGYEDTISLWNGQFRVYGLAGKGGVHPEDLGLVSLVFEVRSKTTVARPWPGFTINKIIGPNERIYYDEQNEEQFSRSRTEFKHEKDDVISSAFNNDLPKPSELRIFPFAYYFGAPPPPDPMLALSEFDAVWLKPGEYKIFLTFNCPAVPNSQPDSYCLSIIVLPTKLNQQQQQNVMQFIQSISNKYNLKTKLRMPWDLTVLDNTSFRNEIKPMLESHLTIGITLYGLIMASYKQSYKMLLTPGSVSWELSSSLETLLSDNISMLYAKDKRYALALMAGSLHQINEATRKKLKFAIVSSPDHKNVFKQTLLR